MNPWSLPRQADIGGRQLRFHADYRDILELLSYLTDDTRPEFLRWHIALALFYCDPVPPGLRQEAMAYLASFLTAGVKGRPGPRLLDWQQDAPLIISDVNRVAGTEIRALPFVHWWTFLSWFHGIGEGRLSTVVALRDKLRRGRKLEPWERQFYRENRSLIDLTSPSAEAQKAHLEALLQHASTS